MIATGSTQSKHAFSLDRKESGLISRAAGRLGRGRRAGPEMTWGGGRRMYNIHSLCEVDRSKIDPLEWPNDNKMKMGNGDEL